MPYPLSHKLQCTLHKHRAAIRPLAVLALLIGWPLFNATPHIDIGRAHAQVKSSDEEECKVDYCHPREETTGQRIYDGGNGYIDSGGSGGESRSDMAIGLDPSAGGEELAANRFTPGCEREANFMNATKSSAQEGSPMNVTKPGSLPQAIQMIRSTVEDFTDQLSGGVKDSNYQDPSWHKMKVIFEGYDYPTAAAAESRTGGFYFLIEIHYWWNDRTFQVDQLKLKTNKEQGCAGQITSVV